MRWNSRVNNATCINVFPCATVCPSVIGFTLAYLIVIVSFTANYTVGAAREKQFVFVYLFT